MNQRPDYASDVVLESEDLRNSGALHVGYAQTKWVAERLIARARERGMPVVVYRPNVAADSRTGAFNAHDHIVRMIAGCIQLGSAPKWDLSIAGAPADYVARAIVHLATRAEAHGRGLTRWKARPVDWNDLVGRIQERGYPLRHIDYDSWTGELSKAINLTRDNALAALSPFFLSEGGLSNVRLPRFDCAAARAALEPAGLMPPPFDDSLLDLYFARLQESGLVPAPEMKTAAR